MRDCLSSSIQQILEITFLFTTCNKDIGIVLVWQEHGM